MDTNTIIILSVCIFSAIVSLISLIVIFLLKKSGGDSGTEKVFRRETDGLRRDMSNSFSEIRNELNGRFDSIRDSMSTSLNDGLKAGNAIQTNALSKLSQEINETIKGMDGRINELRAAQERKLDSIREVTERKLSDLQKGNQEKLNEIQSAVDEKLQKTLNERVSESFKIVSEQLEQVYKSMGEMHNLAAGVGDLKKILSNVKTRGIFGEIQLSRILEQILTSEQYCVNVATKPGSSDRVEFAVKLPAKNPSDKNVLLPIDAKFPMDHYNALLDASETGERDLIDRADRLFESCIKKNAKDIRDKYIDPPNTTDFAIMFLPTESLYAEVAKRGALTEEIARVYNVNIAGPSTISALLNSLQMGFRTLAIEKRSHEVWNILSAVKTEFETFSGALASVQKRLKLADDDLDKLVGTRTRQMMRKLREVQTLPSVDAAKNIIGDGDYESDLSEDDDVE